MAMRQDYGTDFVPVFQQIGEIRDYQVDAQQIIPGKHESRVDDNNIVVVANRHYVHAEFAQPAQRNDFHPIIRHVACTHEFNGAV
jgi:hypothetical protein